MTMMIRLPPPLRQVERTRVLYEGRKLVYFGGCDYFRLASHPDVCNALETGLRKYGLNVAASRATTGNHRLYEEMEEALCDFFGVKASVFVPSGYTANLVATEALTDRDVFIDEKSHTSLASAVRHMRGAGDSASHRESGGKARCPQRAAFSHRNAAELRALIRKSKRPLIATDGLFGQDGEIAPLEKYLDLLPKNGLLLVDDAHGAGTLGKSGRGTPELLGIKTHRIVQTITLSKAFGVYGGAVLGSKELREAIISRSGMFIGQTPLPLPLVAAGLKSLGILHSDNSLRARLGENTRFLKRAVRGAFPIPDNPSPIISIIPSNRAETGAFQKALLKAEIFPSFIRYIGGPKNGYFRFAISSEHSRQELQRLVHALSSIAEGRAQAKPSLHERRRVR